MKVTVKHKKPSDNYPKLMNMIGDTNVIFLFLREGNGFVIQSSDEKYKILDSDNRYLMDVFEDFDGKVILKNK